MSNPTVFITGASDGLGRQMALEFARRGYDLAISARRSAVLNSLREKIQTFSDVRVETYPLDVSDVAAVQETLPRAAKEFGQLDIVIANAGLGTYQKIGEGDFNSMKAMIDVNITGAFATIDTAVLQFKQQGFGQIVGVASVAAVRGLPTTSTYSATKTALRVYMDALRAELWNDDLTVTTLSPGYIDTSMNKHLKSRPFVIPAEKGGRLLVDNIVKKVKHAYVPSMPWALVAPILYRLPDFAAARQNAE